MNIGTRTAIMGTAIFQKLRRTKNNGLRRGQGEREKDEQSVRVFVHAPEWVKVHSLGRIKSVQGRWEEGENVSKMEENAQNIPLRG
jgi:hypothetical protein